MQSMIMAGGEGIRIRPLTCDIPKPMVPLLGKPCIDYSLELLCKHGIQRVAVTLQYLPDKIMNHLNRNPHNGLDIRYCVEDKPLGTAGSVKLAMEHIDETFVIVSGDALTDIDLGAMLAFHREKGSQCTLALRRVDNPVDYGVVLVNENGQVNRFQEKPNWGDAFSDLANTGIYILEPEVISKVPSGEKFDFANDLFPRLLADGTPMFGFIPQGYWCDIGSTGQYIQAQMDMLKGKVQVNINATEREKGIFIHSTAAVAEETLLQAPCYVGPDCQVAGYCSIGPGAVLSSRVAVAQHASIKQSILWEQTQIDANVQLRGAILCDHCTVMQGSRVFEGVIVGKNTTIDRMATLLGGVRIWPSKHIERHAVISRDVLWGSQRPHSIFSERGITGMLNRDITPESLSQLGSGFASLHRQTQRIAIGTWGDKGRHIVREAFGAGLLSGGAVCIDMQETPPFMLRYAVRRLGLQGGVHITSQGGHITLQLLDATGCTLGYKDQKRLENTLLKHEYNMADYAHVGSMIEMKNIQQFYTQDLLQCMRSSLSPGWRIALFSDDPSLLEYCGWILGQMECTVVECLHRNQDDPQEYAKRMAYDQVDIGLVLRNVGEEFALLDETGAIHEARDLQALLAVMVMRSAQPGEMPLPLPVTLPAFLKSIGEQYAVETVESHASRNEWMHRVMEHSNQDGFIRQVDAFFDGVWACAAISSLLAKEKTSLSHFCAELPAAHLNEKTAFCPWEKKGKVLRGLVEEKKNTHHALGGVKVSHENGWASIAPDRDAPLFHIYTEASNHEFAEDIAGLYEEYVRKVSEESDDPT